MAWIAVDVGTSVIKAVVFADDGCELALARTDTAVLHPEAGFSEQDMDSLWGSLVTTVLKANQGYNEAIEGIAITAQGDGAWLVDKKGDPTGNAVLWNDARAASIVEEWHQTGLVEQAFRISGSVAFPGLASAILCWLQRNQPERLLQSRWLLSCNGWLFARLTGKFSSEISDASNPFSDIFTGSYSEELIDLYSLRAQRHLLPPIQTGKENLGSLSPTAAESLRLPVGLPVVMAPYDIVSTAYGCGSVSIGKACVILGTTLCTEVITDELMLPAEPCGTTIALGNRRHLRAMPTLTGCEALGWAARALGNTSISSLEKLASRAPAGSNGALFLPYLSPAGERSPFLEPRARGSFHALSLEHSQADLAHAVYEGLSFVIRECLAMTSATPLEEIYVCGGGARSDLWCQMLADVTGLSLFRASDNEVGARGAFLYARSLMCNTSLNDLARICLPPAVKFSPSSSQHRAYNVFFDLFLRSRRIAQQQWNLRTDMASV